MSLTVWDFLISFFGFFTLLTIIIVVLVFRNKSGKLNDNDKIDQDTVVVKEIVKIRCRYCGYTYDQGLDSCPNCGART